MGRGVDFPAERVRMVDRLVRSGYLKDAAVRAPYACIIATAGAPRIPPAWPVQLAPDGRIVAPIGSSPHGQVLVVAARRSDGTFEVREGTPCAFVPLVGAQAWPA